MKFNTWKFNAIGASFSPYAKLIAGYDRESSNYSGTTAAGGLSFVYHNQLDTWRIGTEFGGRFELPIGGKLGLYSDAAIRLIYNKASIDSSLNFSGLVNASEMGSANANKFDVGFVGGGGVYARTGKATLSAGVAVETWQVPTLLYSNTAPVSVDFDERLSISGKLSLRIAF